MATNSQPASLQQWWSPLGVPSGRILDDLLPFWWPMRGCSAGI